METSNTAKNDITKALLISKAPSDDYRKGWDRIFGKKQISGKLPQEKTKPINKENETEPNK